MTRILKSFLIALLCISTCAGAALAQLRWEPYEVQGSDRKALQGELGRLRVPEIHTDPHGPSIEIAFVRFRTKNPKPGPTCVYLAGGPGASGVEYSPRLASGRMLRLLDTCDVIGIDQRGTGASLPNLASGPKFPVELALDVPVTRESYAAAYLRAAQASAQYWKGQGVRLQAYNTSASAEDVDAVREALGLEQIMLWGESYGTHLALAYLRRHSAHVSRAVLIRTEGPDHTLKLPSTTQKYLEQLHQLVLSDPKMAKELPDLLGTVAALLQQLAKDPVRVELEHEGQSISAVVGAFDLQFYLANALGLAFEFRSVPAALLQMKQGNWSALKATALMLRRDEVGSAMALMMDCSSLATPQRLKRIELERKEPRNLLSDAVNVPYPDACSACGTSALGPEYYGPIQCATPVLFVSGSLDARTPPDNVLELLSGFPNGRHLVAENAGHEAIEMLSAEYREILQRFQAGESVESRVVKLPQVRFQSP